MTAATANLGHVEVRPHESAEMLFTLGAVCIFPLSKNVFMFVLFTFEGASAFVSTICLQPLKPLAAAYFLFLKNAAA